MFKTILKTLAGILVAVACSIGLLFLTQPAAAQNFQVNGVNFWKLVNGTLTPTNPNWSLTVGTLNATTATISGVGTGNMVPSTNNTFNLGSATQTWANLYIGTGIHASGTSDFVNITWTNGTGTNTFSTNLTATNLFFTNATSAGALSIGSVSTTNGSASAPAIHGSDVDSGFYSLGGRQWQYVQDGVTKIQFDNTETLMSQNFIPSSANNYSVGTLTSPFLNGTFQNVSGTTVTTTNLWVKNGGSLNDPAIRFGSVATGLYSNGTNQIGMVINGNSFATFDASNYLQILQVNPQGVGVGSIGRPSLPWGEVWSVTVTSSNIYVNNVIRPMTNNFVNLGSATTSFANVYASGTAFLAQLQLSSTVITAGTTGSQTIATACGRVNFAAGATAVVVTSTNITVSSNVQATVAKKDSNFRSVSAVPSAGFFTLNADQGPAAETPVAYCVLSY